MGFIKKTCWKISCFAGVLWWTIAGAYATVCVGWSVVREEALYGLTVTPEPAAGSFFFNCLSSLPRCQRGADAASAMECHQIAALFTVESTRELAAVIHWAALLQALVM